MNLLTQLMLSQPCFKARPPIKAVPKRVVNDVATKVFGPLMRGKGPMTNEQLRALTGKTRCAVNSSMYYVLIPKGLVRKVPRRRGKMIAYDYEWIDKA